MTKMYIGYNDMYGNPIFVGDIVYVLDGPDSLKVTIINKNGNITWKPCYGCGKLTDNFSMPSKREVTIYWAKITQG